MIEIILAYIVQLGPLVAAALVFGLVLIPAGIWGYNKPQTWFLPLILLVAVLPVFSGDDSGSVMRQISWSFLFIAAFVLVLAGKHDKGINDRLDMPAELIVLLALLALSILWSQYPLQSVKRFSQIVGVCAIGLLMVRQWREGYPLSHTLRRATLVVMLLGIAYTAAFPAKAFDHEGAYTAIASHKNSWGQFAWLSAIVWLHELFSQDLPNDRRTVRKRIFAAAMLLVSIVALALTKSATSYLSFATAIGLSLGLWFCRARKVGTALILMGLLTAVVASMLSYTVMTGELPFDALTGLIYKITDRSSTLTGRLQLWQLIGSEIQNHIWFGTGYGGFWTGLDGPSGALVRKLNWGPPTQAHGGYLDVVNEIGVVGAAVLVVVLVHHLLRIIRLSEVHARNMRFHALLLGAVLVNNYAESSLLRTTHFLWIVLVASILEVYAIHRRQFSLDSTSIRRKRPHNTTTSARLSQGTR